jgi:hypothetical protein
MGIYDEKRYLILVVENSIEFSTTFILFEQFTDLTNANKTKDWHIYADFARIFSMKEIKLYLSSNYFIFVWIADGLFHNMVSMIP